MRILPETPEPCKAGPVVPGSEADDVQRSQEIAALVIPPLFIAELWTEQQHLERMWDAQDRRIRALDELIDVVAAERQRVLHVAK